MADRWRTKLFEVCEEVEHCGGEVRIIFIKRDNDRTPVIRKYPDNQIFCEREVIIDED